MMQDTKVGMFWCIEGKVVGEAVILSEAEPYGDALQHGGHYDFWDELKPETDVERRLKSHAYDYYPRGRVVYFKSRQHFRLYVDGCLNTGNREAIVAFFGLEGVQLENERDEHYQCARCNKGYLE
ncbi:hypothetical protein FY034_00085 [Trichlorobacter lovleyi]|uniref:hypothetical protein n=1 Tax=Trichlorobacter lovleyi TaxID=313985 RepID=UPI00224064BB|nr:hypothetical protein [Trichlorobacter lovleyi]QOX77405.1 hypothetical protein FY034_00085 [Trichlorobacter lovleyi]